MSTQCQTKLGQEACAGNSQTYEKSKTKTAQKSGQPLKLSMAKDWWRSAKVETSSMKETNAGSENSLAFY
jgi:hypothetical protein